MSKNESIKELNKHWKKQIQSRLFSVNIVYCKYVFPNNDTITYITLVKWEKTVNYFFGIFATCIYSHFAQ